MRWGILGAALIFAAVLWFLWHWLYWPLPLNEPKIVSDSVKSDPECVALLRGVARREHDIVESVLQGGKPTGLKCSTLDVYRAMKSEGAFLESSSKRALRFKIRSKERWLLSKPSKFGTYEYDLIIVARDEDGTINRVNFGRPYIT
jgi:hypothetical protein